MFKLSLHLLGSADFCVRLSSFGGDGTSEPGGPGIFLRSTTSPFVKAFMTKSNCFTIFMYFKAVCESPLLLASNAAILYSFFLVVNNSIFGSVSGSTLVGSVGDNSKNMKNQTLIRTYNI